MFGALPALSRTDDDAIRWIPTLASGQGGGRDAAPVRARSQDPRRSAREL